MSIRQIRSAEILAIIAFLTTVVVFSGFAKTAQAQGECVEDDIPMNYSLYYEDYRNGGWETSLPYLRWILRCAPGFPSSNDRNYRRLVEVYEGLAMDAEDDDTRRVYLDSALYIHDIAPSALMDAGIEAEPYNWIFNKGRFIQKNFEHLEDLQPSVGGIYLDAYNLDASKMQHYYINVIIVDFVTRDEKSDAIEFMDRVEVDFAGDAEILTTLETWRGTLFTSPEERIGFLEGQIEKKPDDAELKEELLDLYMDEGIRDKAYEMAEQVMNESPTPRLYRTVAKMRLDDGDTAEAIRLYEASLTMEGGEDAAKEVYFNIGIGHQQEGRLASARSQFRRAINSDPTYVQALIAIGDLYVTSVQGCGSFEREDRAVYWLAADYFNRATSRADTETYKNQARQRASDIQRFFPTAEDKFFKNWTTGDRYAVDYGCYTWVGETTTVR